jgi:hypothetical protein
MPFPRVVLAAIVATSGIAAPLRAQGGAPAAPSAASGEYQPDQKNPYGPEIVAVFLSSSTCIANQDPHLRPAVREMMRRLGVQRDSLHIGLSIIGVSTDWSTRDGLAYLQQFGEFDELAVGRNWFNDTVIRYVWQSPGSRPSEPQVILVARTLDPGTTRVTVSPERVLARIVSGDSIIAWASRGAPLPAMSSTESVP